jgi:hypothetical protein
LVLHGALAKPQAEEVEDGRLLRHLWQARIRSLEHVLPGLQRRAHHPDPRVDLAHRVQRRFRRDQIEGLHHLVFELVGYFGRRLCLCLHLSFFSAARAAAALC